MKMFNLFKQFLMKFCIKNFIKQNRAATRTTATMNYNKLLVQIEF